LEQARVTPKEFIKNLYNVEINSPEEIPAKTLSGEDISAKKKNLIIKAWKKQEESNVKLQAELSKKGTLFQDLQEEIAQLKREIAELS